MKRTTLSIIFLLIAGIGSSFAQTDASDDILPIASPSEESLEADEDDASAGITENSETEELENDEYPSIVNENTGYIAGILDVADLLNETEEENLLASMAAMTEWGNAIFCTTSEDTGMDPQYFAAEVYEDIFGPGESGSIFFIDMYQRRLEIHSDGEVYATINEDYAQSITDNIYRMASAGDYYSCATEAFNQMVTLLAGGKIRQPMKHISNYLIALALALLICYFYMKGGSKTDDKKAQTETHPVYKGGLSNITVTPGKLTKRIIETSSRSGGGGFSGGGGGGGGHSGGGGGHGF